MKRNKFEAKYSLEAVEKKHILEVLALAEDNRTHTAELLGIGIRTLQRKLHIYKAQDEKGGPS